jgi:broad specificity phosphatase PhoE
MSVRITYFVHGTTVDNENEVSSGWHDAKLSEKGVRQALELKDQTKHLKFDVVFSSDLSRAVESAELAWKGVYPLFQDKRLRECNYGDDNGEPSSIVEPMQEQCIAKSFPNGENYEDVKARIADFLKFLKQEYDGRHVAIVAHKAPQLALDVLLKGWSWEEAFARDWRKRKAWQPGWEYTLLNQA